MADGSNSRDPKDLVEPSTLNNITMLEIQLRSGEAIGLPETISEDEYYRWKQITKHIIYGIFGSGSEQSSLFNRAGNNSSIALGSTPPKPDNPKRDEIKEKLFVLKKLLVQLEAKAAVETLQIGVKAVPKTAAFRPGVFLVHGRNDGVRESVARFLEKLSLPVTILSEQSNRGRTVIEKFEDHASEVGFAIVLLTGDDKGGLSTDPTDNYRLRARQNVILELGYFLGKLGRGRVCALYEAGVEIPSDYSGVLFVEIDPHRRWHVELSRELKAAGFTVDMNKAFE